jgi:hypothetical protein
MLSREAYQRICTTTLRKRRVREGSWWISFSALVLLFFAQVLLSGSHACQPLNTLGTGVDL